MPDARFDNIGACVFDAYGTLFDVAAAAERCRAALGENADPLAALWRQKQLQYTWLRGLMGEHAEFWQVTGEALDYAMGALSLEDRDLRERLMDLYLRLDAYPEVKGVLARLKGAGVKTAILSNGSPRMLEAAVDSAGIADLFDAVLSVEEVGVFKPHPDVYRLGVERLGLPAAEMAFQSANAWDAAAAAHFGYRVVWINRFGQPRERIPGIPAAEIDTLDGLAGILGLE